MKITVEYIARLAGVSKATVSRVINDNPNGVSEETRNRVKDIIEKLNYQSFPNVNQQVGSFSKTIGLIIPDIMNPFFSEIVKTIETCADKYGYTVLVGNSDSSIEKETKYISTFIAKKVDGLILTSCCETEQESHRLLKKFNIPCVLLDRNVTGMTYTAGVFADNLLAVSRSCELLIKNNKREIVYLSGPKGLSTTKERLDGYKATLEKYGVVFNKDLVRYGNYTVESGYSAIMELEREGIRYNAVVAANDMMAFGILKALKELDYKIPYDVEVIGFDNILFTTIWDPPLTTVQQPTIEMGRLSMELLLKAIQGEMLEKKNYRLLPKLIIRKTTQ